MNKFTPEQIEEHKALIKKTMRAVAKQRVAGIEHARIDAKYGDTESLRESTPKAKHRWSLEKPEDHDLDKVYVIPDSGSVFDFWRLDRDER